jgi:hypothetical protein
MESDGAVRKVGVETCGPYTIVNELGSGDGWISFLGRDERGEVLLTVSTAGAEVIRQVTELQQRASAASPHVAAVLDQGTCDDGDWYATRAYPRNVAKLLEGRVELNRAWILQILLAMTRGALAFKKTCGRAHGNLQPSNVLLSRTPNIKEAEIVIKDPAVEAADATRLELRDLNAIGMTLYQLVRRREIEERAIILPLEISQEWRARFGKDADRWVALCNRLLDRSLSIDKCTLEDLERALVALEPKAAVSRKQLMMAAGVILCATVAGLIIAWLSAQATLEVTSNLPGVKVVVKSAGQPVKTITVQTQPVTVKVRKGGTYVVEGERDEFRVANTVVVTARKQPAPLQFAFGVLKIDGVVVQDGATNRLWSTNRYVLPGVEVRQMIAIQGYQPEAVKETLAAGGVTNVVRVLQKSAPGNVRIEIRVLPVTARFQVRDAANRVWLEDSGGGAKDLPPGKYQVLLQYEAVTQTNEFVVSANAPRTGANELSFEIKTGQLRLIGEDGPTEVRAKIFHGSREIGFTTDPAKYWPTGTWTFRLEADGYEETNVVVRVSAGVPVTRTQALIPVVAILDITSDPPGGVVFGTNQNQLAWKAPMELRVPPGQYTFYARHEDLGSISKAINVGKGQFKVPLEFSYGKVKLTANLTNVNVSHQTNPVFRPIDSLSVLPVGSSYVTGVYSARLTNVLAVTVTPAAKQTPVAVELRFDYGEVIFSNSLAGAEVFYEQQGRLVPVGTIRNGEILRDIAPPGNQIYKARALVNGAMKTNSWSLNVVSRGANFVEADFKGPVNHKTPFGMEFVWIESLSNYVGKYEVTQFEYQTVMGSNPSIHRANTNNPVESLTWAEAWEFCQRLPQLSPPPEGFRYTLPARTQWEAFTANALRDPTMAVIKKPELGPAPRGSLPANKFDLHDVRGNVWEWTLEKTHVGSSFKSAILGPSGWRPAGENPSTYKDDETGFRVILVPHQPASQQARK